MLTIAVLGTFDTKGAEHEYVAEWIRAAGHRPLLIDIGTKETSSIAADVSPSQIMAGSATGELSSLDRGRAIAAMTERLPSFIQSLVEQKRIHGIISLAGSGGTALATSAMRALPLGFPKVMVSTMASGDVSRYVGVSDLVMFPSIVDVSGLNRISRGVFSRAAATVVAMAEANTRLGKESDAKPLIVASMFGNTTQCVERARARLEAAGYEVLVFHATGAGGRTMEAIIDSGLVAGVLDVTTTEWADELVGGILTAGPHRLEAAARHGVPAIVAPGCLDMVNFGEPSSVPGKFRGRTLYQHNPQVTLLRTNVEECRELGRIVAEKVNESTGPVEVVFPRKGISVISAPGGPFHDAAADEALLRSLKNNLRSDIPFQILDCNINEPAFADYCVERLLELMAKKQE